MRVYIAGPMTGVPLLNFPLFDYTAAQWRDAGYDVVNPADITRVYWRTHYREEFNPEGTDPRTLAGGDIYREFLRNDLAAISTCDAIALLPGWEKSAGVAKELAAARLLELEEFNAQTFAPIAPAHETILQEAQRLVHGDRGVDYGHPIVDYKATGRMWGAILERHLGIEIPDVDPRIACLMMAAVKISREAGKPKRDNLADLAGYTECAHMVGVRQGVHKP